MTLSKFIEKCLNFSTIFGNTDISEMLAFLHLMEKSPYSHNVETDKKK